MKKSEEFLKRKELNVPRGPFNTVLNFVDHAKGSIMTDVDGNDYIDFAGGIGTLNVGHCPQRVVDALKNQIEKYIHPCFHVMMYEPYIQLAEKLNEITPGDHHKKTFFLNSGAEAVENAVKIARKFTGRKAIISFERGFHGRTLLAMSLTSKVKPYKFEFGPFAPETYKMPYPYYYRDDRNIEETDAAILNKFEEFFLGEVPPEEIAAIIFEPVQGEGGFVIPSKTFVKGLRQICDKYNILLIADEIQTGFGRTGKMFAMEHFDVIPDLMTMSKSIAAGLPISAVTGRAEIMDAPAPGEIGGTYGGSPLGCVAALEVISMIKEEQLLARANEIGDFILKTFYKWKTQYDFIGDVRGIGAMCALEIVKDKTSKTPDADRSKKIIGLCNQNGVAIMGAGLYSNVIRILSPLVITNEQLQKGLQIMELQLNKISETIST
ncbi:4-aminobutyrate--2-oxoglutarate transaminase [Fictibacillus barbaricus]|uniref:(S)-3-amino-2-methylpropionate transaminase n=1 Tax=Fictibacillus barbaricus TaxID=182136 RepID=A0ABS2ZE86_9BACL|nr:4-aminobutyrate--2-oxoglutarate transaminase [Fictibacillus barbaricus]MBN3545653.1 4-aminobutyrate--2-oxoglutarate transaminase [Fictibacillus barbaricus]GGB55097.1 4-aminobutyrate--2-oxoglutarate transaminase [Fictibacillus barbaricus]